MAHCTDIKRKATKLKNECRRREATALSSDGTAKAYWSWVECENLAAEAVSKAAAGNCRPAAGNLYHAHKAAKEAVRLTRRP